MDLKKCQIFTPQKTVLEILDLIEYKEGIFGKKIIDNSCGTGNFLVEVVRRFIIDAINNNISNRKIINGLQKCIYGCDIDPCCVSECKKNLDIVANKFNLKGIKWNIYICDGLYFDRCCLFDYVVGNPPYISYLNLDKLTRTETKKNFDSCSIGKFDYSYAFIEKGLKILAKGGKMGLITPANMFKTVYAEKLRELIKPNLTHIIDYSSMKIFENVLTSPAITIYERDCKSNFLIYREMNKDNGKEKLLDKSKLNGKWNFEEYESSGEKRFGDYYKASNCIATLANYIFIHKITDDKCDIDIEKKATKVAKSPKSEQFSINQVIIFPYYYKKGTLQRYSEKQITKKFPKTMDYLRSQKTNLEKRDSDINAKWFEYGRSQALQHINQRKLLISTIITKKVSVYDLDKNIVPYSGIFIIPRGNQSLDEAKLILQTERFYNYLLTKGVKINGQSIRISSKDIENYRY